LKNWQNIEQIEKRVIVDMTQRAEEIICKGLSRFPEDSFLLEVESRLAKILQDYEKAYDYLEKAFKANPRSGYLAVRLSKHLKSINRLDEANRVLELCLNDNPESREVHFEIALSLINKDEITYKDEIERHLRSSFTDGDTNYEVQFWSARHNFLFGDRKRATTLFEGLKKAKLPSSLRNRVRGYVLDSEGRPKRFTGNPLTPKDGFCFVHCMELAVDIYIHYSQLDDSDWDKLSPNITLSFLVGFNMNGVLGTDVRIEKT
jgi:tetratricopeptide (TPR) repeat protein